MKKKTQIYTFPSLNMSVGIMRDSASENRTENGPVDLNLAQHLSSG